MLVKFLTYKMILLWNQQLFLYSDSEDVCSVVDPENDFLFERNKEEHTMPSHNIEHLA